VGIELESEYIDVARKRIDSLPLQLFDETELVTWSKRSAPRVSLGQLIEGNYLNIGQRLYSKDRKIKATIKADSQLIWGDVIASIHRVAALVLNRSAFNGWEYWYAEDSESKLVSIDELREKYRTENGLE
jgi:site-specific DNA-methyltransferase (adenine-specific)